VFINWLLENSSFLLSNNIKFKKGLLKM